ncbi:hypothetical protein [Haloglycomyces albus]|uniref:hypothetical protein n=1 Tax=Haloglycomyces albus TaxID=526067 RepID=UPI00046D6165|nr:hypothetical protein [Haloglycomyces albus]
MRVLIDLTLSFPPIIFTVGMGVLLVYWVLVLLGVFDIDAIGPSNSAGSDGFPSSLGFGIVPTPIIVSLWILIAWLVTLLGSMWLRPSSGTALWSAVAGSAVLLAGLGLGILITKLVALPLSEIFLNPPLIARHDLVGRNCIVTTESVSTVFGQGEIPDDGGTSHAVNIRRTEHEPSHVRDEQFKRGATVVIFDYDEASDTFSVIPAEVGLVGV